MPQYPTDPEVRAEILQLRTELGKGNKGVADALQIEGVCVTFLSKYINDKLDRQVPNFEGRFRDTLKSLRERIAFGAEIFETSVTRRFRNACDLVRRTGDFGLITSPAGNGKTSGIHAYCYDNPSAVRITLNATTRAANKLESLVFASIDTQSWKSNSPRFDHLAARFREVSRLLIIDNAQRLDSSGRQWAADFHDAADCPVMLVGNPEAVEAWQLIDQQRSRIGLCNNYELEDDELPACAKRVARQYSDAATADEIEDLTAIIASHEGRLRAVKKTVVLAQELRAASPKLKDDPRAALRAAHSRLLRDYALPVD
jgi:DNA transposition AAA+ family ATPase